MKLRVSLLTLMLGNTHTNFGRFIMLALQTMAGDELKDDVRNATSFFKRSSMTFCMKVGLDDRNQHCIEH